MDEVWLVICNAPDCAIARTLAAQIIGAGAAACVNIMSPCESIYRWEGGVETSNEIPLFIKTTRAKYPALEALIRAHHPYDTPEIIALPLVAGLTAYLQWVAGEIRR